MKRILLLYKFSLMFQGLPVPMVGSMAETAGLFVAYSQLQTLVRWSRPKPSSEDLSIAEHGLAAGGAGFLTSFILYVSQIRQRSLHLTHIISGHQLSSSSAKCRCKCSPHHSTSLPRPENLPRCLFYPPLILYHFHIFPSANLILRPSAKRFQAPSP